MGAGHFGPPLLLSTWNSRLRCRKSADSPKSDTAQVWPKGRIEHWVKGMKGVGRSLGGPS